MSSSRNGTWVRLRPGVRVGPEVQDDRGHCVYVQDTASRRMYRFDAETGGFLRQASGSGGSPVPLSSAIDSLTGRGARVERAERALDKLRQLGILEVDGASSAPASPQPTAHRSTAPRSSARETSARRSAAGPTDAGSAAPPSTPSTPTATAASRAATSEAPAAGTTTSGSTAPTSAVPAGSAVHLFDPSALLAPVARRLGWTLGPAGIALTLLALVVVAAVVLQEGHAALRSAVGDAASWPWTVPVAAVVVLGQVVAHELAHGAALVAWGVRCRSFGLPGRPLPVVGCDLSGVAEIPGRWRRASVFLAGLGTSWVVAGLLLAAWTIVPHPSAIATTLAGAGLATAVLATLQTLPWRGSDTGRALAELRRRTPGQR